MPKVYGLPMYPRLRPITLWAGGRITETDVLTLDEAAKMASKHAGTEITVQDFLRAAGRGEILLRAVLNRTVVMQPCNVEDIEFPIPETAIPTLPLIACQGLANTGNAKWRHIDCFEIVEEFGGQLCRYQRWRLSDDEPDIETTIEDCRVIGFDVHALADAYKDLGVSLPDLQTSPILPKPKEPETTKIHRIVNRSGFLNAEIALAKEKASHPDDPICVWNELVKLAEQRTGAMIGFSSDGVQYRGRKYQNEEMPDVFTLKNLRDRMRPRKTTG